MKGTVKRELAAKQLNVFGVNVNSHFKHLIRTMSHDIAATGWRYTYRRFLKEIQKNSRVFVITSKLLLGQFVVRSMVSIGSYKTSAMTTNEASW